jgi:spermidine synthase
MPEPASGQSNRFYTKEFFEQCAGKLNSGGVTALRLRSAENF